MFKTQIWRGVRGQGVVEYSLILVFVAIIVIAIIAILGGGTSKQEPQPSASTSFSDQQARAAFAQSANMNEGNVVIKRGLHSPIEHSYILEVSGRPAIGWCDVVNNQPDCRFGYTDHNR
jgi:Flp pilus assembly pilin Flp